MSCSEVPLISVRLIASVNSSQLWEKY